jgi:hypothetical protein
MRKTSWLRHWNRADHRSDRGRPQRRRRQQPLILEVLEERLVPTVVFDAQFQKETVPGTAPFTVLNSPSVCLIFWGKSWGTTQGSQDVASLRNLANSVVGSPYLAGMQEYGNVGTAVYGGAWTDSASNPPAGFNAGAAGSIATDQSEVAKAITNNPTWAPHGTSITQSPVYVVIAAADVSNSGGGYNGAGSYGDGQINICSLSTGYYTGTSRVIQDYFGQVFSHELAERISDPGSGGVTVTYPTDPSYPGYINETINPPNVNNNPSLAGNQTYLANGGQNGDGEQEPGGQPHYGYRLNGVKVQSLWSAQTLDSSGRSGAFTVADGNTESIYLDPIWTTGTIPGSNPPITGPSFTGNYNLHIIGDHQSNSPANDVISIDASDSQVNVVLDGQNFSFSSFQDGGQIKTITVDAKGGTNSISVYNLAADQTVNIVGGGTDSVTIGTGFFSSTVQGIQGLVVISNAPAFTTINIDDSGDSTPQNFIIGTNPDGLWGYVHDTALPNFNVVYRYADTASLRLNTGTASGNVVGVWENGVTTNVVGYGPATTVYVGDGLVGVQSIRATLNIQNQNYLTTISIDDSANPAANTAHMGTIPFGEPGWGYITGLSASADIHYKYADTASLTIKTSTVAGAVFGVWENGVPTTLINNAAASVYVGDGNVGLDAIPAALTVRGNGTDALSINDQQNPNLLITQDFLTSTSLTRLGQTFDAFGVPDVFHSASITYSGLGSLVLNTGALTNLVHVESTATSTTVNAGVGTALVDVSASAQNLDNLPAALTVHGNGTVPLIVNDQNNANLLVTQDFLSSTNLTRLGQTFDQLGVPDVFHSASITYSGLGSLVLNTGALTNVVHVESTASPTTVNAGAGTALIDVSPQAQNLDNLVGPLTISGNGSVPLIIYDQNEPNLVLTQDFLSASGLTRMGQTIDPITGLPVFHVASITFGGLGSLTLNTGNFVNLVHVESTAASTTVNAGAGTALIDVSPQAQNLSNIAALLTVNGGGGSGSLILDDQGAAAAEAYTIGSASISHPGSARVAFAGIQAITLNGGNHGNSVRVSDTAAGTTLALNTGAGNDTIIVGNAANSLDSVQGALSITGQGGTNTLKLNDQGSSAAHAYTLTANSVSRDGAATVTFANIKTLVISGSTGGGAFVVQAAPTGATTTLTGGSGTNTLTGPNANETWTISTAGGGKLGASIVFTAMHDLVGGSLGDTFKFTGSGSIAGTVNGGGGTGNKLDYSGLAGPISVNLPSRAAPLVHGGAAGGFSNIGALAGSMSSADTLTGLDADTVWTISSVNGGKAGTFAFSGIENLVGGAGVDVFKFTSTGSVAGSINGGGAPLHKGNWLDYSGLIVSVTVNLQTGSATGVANAATGKVTNVQNVHGGNAGNTLTGNSQGNILIGGTGVDTVTGGTGVSLLIGDKGADVIAGRSGGDILIGDATTFDTMSTANENALMSILAEWQSANSYALRISHLKNGGGLNGTSKLILGTTVKDDLSVDQLTGGNFVAAALDWFFQSVGDALHNKETGEQIN